MTLQQTAYNKIDMLSDKDLKILLVLADELLRQQNIQENDDVEKKIIRF